MTGSHLQARSRFGPRTRCASHSNLDVRKLSNCWHQWMAEPSFRQAHSIHAAFSISSQFAKEVWLRMNASQSESEIALKSPNDSSLKGLAANKSPREAWELQPEINSGDISSSSETRNPCSRRAFSAMSWSLRWKFSDPVTSRLPIQVNDSALK